MLHKKPVNILEQQINFLMPPKVLFDAVIDNCKAEYDKVTQEFGIYESNIKVCTFTAKHLIKYITKTVDTSGEIECGLDITNIIKYIELYILTTEDTNNFIKFTFKTIPPIMDNYNLLMFLVKDIVDYKLLSTNNKIIWTINRFIIHILDFIIKLIITLYEKNSLQSAKQKLFCHAILLYSYMTSHMGIILHNNHNYLTCLSSSVDNITKLQTTLLDKQSVLSNNLQIYLTDKQNNISNLNNTNNIDGSVQNLTDQVNMLEHIVPINTNISANNIKGGDNNIIETNNTIIKDENTNNSVSNIINKDNVIDNIINKSNKSSNSSNEYVKKQNNKLSNTSNDNVTLPLEALHRPKDNTIKQINKTSNNNLTTQNIKSIKLSSNASLGCIAPAIGRCNASLGCIAPAIGRCNISTKQDNNFSENYIDSSPVPVINKIESSNYSALLNIH